MTAPMTEDPHKARVKRNVEKMASMGASSDEIETYIHSEGIKPVETPAEKPGLVDRVLSGVGGAVSQAINHPIDTAESLIVAPVKSAFNAVVNPVEGEARHDARLSKGGNSSGRPIETGTYDREHGAISKKEQEQAAVQTLANAALPGVAGTAGRFLGPVAASATAGALGGAAYTPDDPLAGALTGMVLGAGAHGAVKGAGKLASGAANVGDALIDVAGRPETSRPLIKAGPVSVGHVEGIQERASRLNAEKLPAIQRPATDKPLAPVDLGGVEAQRLARGLKTSSPAAESVLRDALQPRAEGAVDRVIQHGLETTGLTSRESGLQLVDDLIAQRAEHGRENFQPIFSRHSYPIDNPEFAEIAKTPAGKQALKRGQTIAANRGDEIGYVTDEIPAPPGIDPKDWENTLRLAKERGIEMPKVEGADRIAPTLKQAHYIKLGFDDMLNSAPEPGSGGSGPNNAAAIRNLKNRWLAAMDEAAPEYATARKQFADESDLIRAAETGRSLWKLHPDEAAKAFKDMSTAEQDVARRAGFDAFAERVENGPKDVERGVAKPRDQKRLRLLFPDDASFEQFREGLKHEAQMHATTQNVLGGSITTDKLADIADMAGVTIPDMMHAATGRVGPLLRKAGTAMLRKSTSAGGNRLAAERARQLVEGAQGRPPIPPMPEPMPLPMNRRLNPGRFDTEPQQGPPMPPIPRQPRRLGPGVTYPPVLGDVQHGTAMPIRQPLPLNRRLPSGGPAAVPTLGDAQLGPGIPAPPVDIDQLVRAEAMRRYRANPHVAVSMTRAEQDAYAAMLREAALQGRVESVPGPHSQEEYFDITSGNQKDEPLRARTAGGSLKSFNKATNAELIAEYRTLLDANAVENTAPTSLRDESGGGPQYVGKKRGAAHATGRVAMRKLSIAKVEAELKARGIDPIDALAGEHAGEQVPSSDDPTAFDFGANVRPLKRRD